MRILRPLSVSRAAIYATLWLAIVAPLGAGGGLRAQFEVDALEQHVTIGRGQLQGVVTVRSQVDTVVQVLVTVKDWVRDSTGANIFSDVGTAEGSCGDRLAVFPRSLQLPAMGTDFVRFTYTPTGSDDPGCWAILMLEPVRPRATVEARMGATIVVQTGVKVYVHPRDGRVEGEIVYADVERMPAGGGVDSLVPAVVVRFVNTGTDHLQAKSSVEFRDASGALLSTQAGSQIFLTPGAYRDAIVRVPALPPGRYVAVVLIDFGGPELLAAQVDFEIP